MKIREIDIRDVALGKNWKLSEESDFSDEMSEWIVEECVDFRSEEWIAYSALGVFEDGEVRPTIVVREIDCHDWWGDTCEFIDGQWKQLGNGGPEPGADRYRSSEYFIANPLPEDPSFTGEYSHDIQRAGFQKWQTHLLK